MKYKHLAFVLAISAVALPAMTSLAHAEEIAPVAAAVPAQGAAEDGDDLKMFRFGIRMDKLEFVKKAMKLNEEQEKKFMSQYYPYDVELKKLNDNRLAIIKDYAEKIDNITDSDVNKLVKRWFDFRKQRAALLEKYYGKMGKATSKVIAARFLQVESILQGTADVVVGSSIPLMPKE